MGKPKRSPAEIAAAPAAPPVPECEYTWHDSISGWEEGRLGYERQEAARAAAAAVSDVPLTSARASLPRRRKG